MIQELKKISPINENQKEDSSLDNFISKTETQTNDRILNNDTSKSSETGISKAMSPKPDANFHQVSPQVKPEAIQMAPNPTRDQMQEKHSENETEDQEVQLMESSPKIMTMGGGDEDQENDKQDNSSSIQPKLTIGKPGDKYEQEADDMADRVMARPDTEGIIQRDCEGCEEEELQMQPLAESITPIVRMQPIEEEEEIQAKSAGGENAASSGLVDQLTKSKVGGKTLHDDTRSSMESAFGTDFSEVKVHTDSSANKMSKGLGALAFTHGPDIYFDEGQYNPTSTGGKHLLAHELTHVVQQGKGFKRAIQKDEPDDEWERERHRACLIHPTESLPQRIGLLAAMYRDSILHRFFTQTELTHLQSLISPNSPEREYVCSEGVRALIALFDTMDGNTLDIGRARQSVLDHPDWYTREAFERRHLRRQSQAAEMIDPVGERIERATRPVEIPSVASVQDLPSDEQNLLVRALDIIGENSSSYTYIDRFLDQALVHIGSILSKFEEARDFTRSVDNAPRARSPLGEAIGIARQLTNSLDMVNIYLNIERTYQNSRELGDNIDSITTGITHPMHTDSIYELHDNLRILRDNCRLIRNEITRIKREQHSGPESIRRVRFVIRYLLAMNDPNYTDAPSENERNQFLQDAIHIFSDDLQIVFGGHLNTTFLSDLRNRFMDQIGVRASMNQRLGADPGAVPNQTSVLDYFRSLSTENNDTVKQAYEDYAGAFLEHRIITNQSELNELSVASIYNRPMGIGGTRRLVCSGYALIGATLLEATGGQIVNFYLGMRASQAQINGTEPFTDAHAGAEILRNGQHIFVSNDSTVGNINGVLGPNAVAWSNPLNHLYRTSGNLLTVAYSRLITLITNARTNP